MKILDKSVIKARRERLLAVATQLAAGTIACHGRFNAEKAVNDAQKLIDAVDVADVATVK